MHSFVLRLSLDRHSWRIRNGVGTNFGVGVEEARPKGPRGGGVLGEGTASPSPPTTGFAGALWSLSGVRGGAPAAEWFSCTLSCQIAFPSISVRVAYSLHGQELGFCRGDIHINIPSTYIVGGVRSPAYPRFRRPCVSVNSAVKILFTSTDAARLRFSLACRSRPN